MNTEKTAHGKNITISRESQNILNKFEETGYFGTNQNEIAKIAISYALGNRYDEGINLDDYVIKSDENLLNKWAVGTIKEEYFEEVIKVLRPETKNINISLRNLIDIGLKKMNEDLWNESSNSLEIEKIFELK